MAAAVPAQATLVEERGVLEQEQQGKDTTVEILLATLDVAQELVLVAVERAPLAVTEAVAQSVQAAPDEHQQSQVHR